MPGELQTLLWQVARVYPWRGLAEINGVSDCALARWLFVLCCPGDAAFRDRSQVTNEVTAVAYDYLLGYEWLGKTVDIFHSVCLDAGLIEDSAAFQASLEDYGNCTITPRYRADATSLVTDRCRRLLEYAPEYTESELELSRLVLRGYRLHSLPPYPRDGCPYYSLENLVHETAHYVQNSDAYGAVTALNEDVARQVEKLVGPSALNQEIYALAAGIQLLGRRIVNVSWYLEANRKALSQHCGFVRACWAALDLPEVAEISERTMEALRYWDGIEDYRLPLWVRIHSSR